MLINFLKFGHGDLSIIGHLVDDCLSKCLRFFSFSFNHVTRDGNTLSHSLIKMTFLFNEFHYLVEEVSPQLYHHICNSDISNK